MLKILCIGNQWRGANDGALFRAFSRLGHVISTADHMNFMPTGLGRISAKIVNRLASPFFIRGFNDHIIHLYNLLKPDLVVVYKGNYLFGETLEKIGSTGTPIICVFPDVSMFAHGPYIPQCIPFYRHIFTTKSFGISDLKTAFNFGNATYLPHGFDPEIHRTLHFDQSRFKEFDCDASFIGTFSPKKEAILSAIQTGLPDLNLKIWGSHWNRASNPAIKKPIQATQIIGDMYAIGIQSSRINIAILSERVRGASSGDQITSRTFHIPGAGGFMIHERTDELLNFFSEDEHMACFADADELKSKIDFFRRRPDLREKLAKTGQAHAQKFHSIDQRAAFILDTLQNERIL